MEPSSDSERQQLEEDIRQIDEALLHDNDDGEFYGSDIEGSRPSEDEAAPGQSVYDDEAEDILQQPSTSYASKFDDEFDYEGSNQEGARSDDDEEEEEEPSLQQLLVLNKRYQEFIVSNLHKVQDALKKNRILQTELLENKKKDKEVDTLPARWAPPYFKDKDSLTPPSNEDTIAISQEGYPMPVNPPYSKPWSKQELNNLKKGVKADGLEKMMWPLLNQREILEGRLKTAMDQRDKQTKKAVVKEINNLDVKLAELKVLPEHKVLGDRKRDVDWDKVASRYLEGNRTAVECQLKWKNHAHPDIRHDWTDEDDKLLKTIVKVHGARNWNTIASELGRGFSAFECLQRYQQRVNDDLYKRPYTEAEDKLLVQLVEKFRMGDHIPWIKVAYFLKDRKDKQCAFRWQSKLDPSLKNGKWSESEDKILVGAVKKYKGRDWAKVAQGIPGRSAQQCRNRWVNVINPDLRKGRFSAVEDQILLEAVKVCGLGHWSHIQTLAQKNPQFLPGRSHAMIMGRYRYLADQHKEKLKKQFKEKKSQFKRACVERHMTSLLGDTQTALLNQVEETFEEYCSKFTKEELLDDIIADAKKRITGLGEKAHWSNMVIGTGYAYQVNREQAAIWKKNQEAAAQAAKDFKDVKGRMPRFNTRHRRIENVLSSDSKETPSSRQNLQLDQELIKAVFPSRTLMPNQFFEKKGKTSSRLFRSEYITSELNKKKPLTWGTAVLVLIKASRVDVHLCKGIIHRSAKLPNINFLPSRNRNLSQVPNFRTLATTATGWRKEQPFTLMLNKSRASETISGQGMGQLPGIPVSLSSDKKQNSATLERTSSVIKQDTPGYKQANPLNIMKTQGEGILLVRPGMSGACGSSSNSSSVSQDGGEHATQRSNLLTASSTGASVARSEDGGKGGGGWNGGITEGEVSDCNTLVATSPRRMYSSEDGGKTETTGASSLQEQRDEDVERRAKLSQSKTLVPPTTVSTFENSIDLTRVDQEGSFVANNLSNKISTSIVSNQTTHHSDSQVEVVHPAVIASHHPTIVNLLTNPQSTRGEETEPQQIMQVTDGTGTVQTGPVTSQAFQQPETRARRGKTVSQLLTQQRLPNTLVVPSRSNQVAASNIQLGCAVNSIPGRSSSDNILNVNTPGRLNYAAVTTGASTVMLPSHSLVNPSQGQQSQPVIVLIANSRDPSVTVPIVTSTTTMPSQTIAQQTQFSKPLLLAHSSMTSQAPLQNNLPQLSGSPLHQNQVGCNPGGVIPNSLQTPGIPGSLVHLVSSPLRQPCRSSSGMPLASTTSGSSLSNVLANSATSTGISQYAQNAASLGINKLNDANQPLDLVIRSFPAVSSANAQDSVQPLRGAVDNAPSSTSGSVVMFSPRPSPKKRRKKSDNLPDPYVHPKMVIGVKEITKKDRSSVEVPSASSSRGQLSGDDTEVKDRDVNHNKNVVCPSLPLNPPCPDGVHCGTDEEDCVTGRVGSPQKKAKMTQGFADGNDGSNCKPCSDGVHCGTDNGDVTGEGGLQAEGLMTTQTLVGNGSNSGTTCSDGVNCGTDDEEDGTARGEGSQQGQGSVMASQTVVVDGNSCNKPCSDGVHCGTDDEDNGTARGEGSQQGQGSVMASQTVVVDGNSCNKPCSDGVHCGTDDEEDGSERGEGGEQVEGLMATKALNESKNNVSSDGGSLDGRRGGPGPEAKEMSMSSKRPRRKAAPKPGSFVMSSTEDDEDSDIEIRVRSSNTKKLKSNQPANPSPSLTPLGMVPVGSSTTVSQMQLPVLGVTTPFISSQPTVLLGPGNVLLGVLPGSSPISQLSQNASILPSINTLPNVALHQPAMNSAVITNLSQQLNMVSQQPLSSTFNPHLITNLFGQLPVTGTANASSLLSMHQPGSTALNVNVKAPSNLGHNTVNGAVSMAGPGQSTAITTRTSTASPVVQSPATTAPNSFPQTTSVTVPQTTFITVPTSQSSGITQHVVPQKQTSVSHVSSFTNVVTSAGSINSLGGVGGVIAQTGSSSSMSLGVGGKLSPSLAVPSGIVAHQQTSGLMVASIGPPKSSFTSFRMPSGGTVSHPLERKKQLPLAKKSSAKSVPGILKETEKQKPHKKSKCGVLPHLMKEDQYTVDHTKMEVFTKSILGTPDINFEKEMPILPPNLVTLFSFKHLLIKKISLEYKASQFSLTLNELQDLEESLSTRKRHLYVNISGEQTLITKEQFLKEMHANPMYSLFKERFTMLFLWPAFLSLLKPFHPRVRRTVMCPSIVKQKLQKQKESQSQGKDVLSQGNHVTSEMNKNVNGEGEMRRRRRGRPRLRRVKAGGKSSNSNQTPKKRIIHNIKSPQLATRRGTRATPLRKNVGEKGSISGKAPTALGGREVEKSPQKTS